MPCTISNSSLERHKVTYDAILMHLIVGAQHVVPSSTNITPYQKLIQYLAEGLLRKVKLYLYFHIHCAIKFKGTKYCAPTILPH